MFLTRLFTKNNNPKKSNFPKNISVKNSKYRVKILVLQNAKISY